MRFKSWRHLFLICLISGIAAIPAYANPHPLSDEDIEVISDRVIREFNPGLNDPFWDSQFSKFVNQLPDLKISWMDYDQLKEDHVDNPAKAFLKKWKQVAPQSATYENLIQAFKDWPLYASHVKEYQETKTLPAARLTSVTKPSRLGNLTSEQVEKIGEQIDLRGIPEFIDNIYCVLPLDDQRGSGYASKDIDQIHCMAKKKYPQVTPGAKEVLKIWVQENPESATRDNLAKALKSAHLDSLVADLNVVF